MLGLQDCLVPKNHDDVRMRNRQQEVKKSREIQRDKQLNRFRACRLQKGFTSEGMLCDEPPIPLRVLDFLDAQDTLRMSLVCKSAHQAAHLLFKREVGPLP